MKKVHKARGKRRYLVVILLIILAAACIPGTVSSLGTETLISTGVHDSNQETPSTWGDYIVWVDQRGGTGHILLLNITSGEKRMISPVSSDARSPRVQETSVVWYENNAGGSDIYHYNITSGLTTRITNYDAIKLYPVMYGSKIVWQEQEATDDMSGFSYYDLEMYDLKTPGQIVNITPHPAAIPGIDDISHTYPSIWGDFVVWQNYDDATGAFEIFMNDTATGTLTQISNDGGAGSVKQHPAISGNSVLWADDQTGDADIFRETVPPAGNTDLTPYSPSVQDLPAIYGDTVIWLDDRSQTGSYYQVGMNNLSAPGETYPLTSASRLPFTSFQSPPSVFRNRVVWQDDRVSGGYTEIYLYTDGVTVTCPVASFTQNISSGSPPLAVQFTDISSLSPAYWFWDFGDGTHSMEQNPRHTFSTNGTYPVTLTVGTDTCRNATSITSAHNITVGAAPVVGFTAYPLQGMVPLNVSFTENSSGSPTLWNWSFGDGSFSNDQNPFHMYTVGGWYSVRCDATNAFGTGTLTRTRYITAMTGAHEIAFTNITGISVRAQGTGQQLVYDSTLLPDYTMTRGGSAFSSHPPLSYGWQKIKFFSSDGIGFVPGSGKITGNVSSTILTTRDILPAGFSSATGSNVRINYQITLDGYQEPGYLITDVWEGTTDLDLRSFEIVHIRSNFASMNSAYTVNTTQSGLGRISHARINMSVGSAWLTGKRGIDWGRQHTYVIALGYDSDGRLKGTVLPARYTFNDTADHLEYFETEISGQYMFLNKYALAQLTGSGNIGQLITLSVTSRANQPSEPAESDSGSDGGPGGRYAPAVPLIATPAPAVTQTPVPPDPGKSAKVYTNAQGVVTQATRLQSTDGRATVSIDEGVVAKDASGKPLAEITLKALPSGSLPKVPAGSAFTFAGMAYEIGPDGATFSPPISLTFTIPQAQWGQDYPVKFFNQKSGTWQDLPTAFDAATGTVTAHFSHLCIFALFTEPRASPVPTPAATPVPAPATPQPQAPPPTTAVGIFTSMMGWAAGLVMNNIVILMAIILLAITVYLVRRGRLPGSGR